MSAIHVLAVMFATFQIYRLANIKRHSATVAYVQTSEESDEEIATEVAQAGLAPMLVFVTFAEITKTLFLAILLFTPYLPLASFLLICQAVIHFLMNMRVFPLYLLDSAVSLVVLSIIAVSPIF